LLEGDARKKGVNWGFFYHISSKKLHLLERGGEESPVSSKSQITAYPDRRV